MRWEMENRRSRLPRRGSRRPPPPLAAWDGAKKRDSAERCDDHWRSSDSRRAAHETGLGHGDIRPPGQAPLRQTAHASLPHQRRPWHSITELRRFERGAGTQLCSCDFHAQLFRQTFPNLLRQPVMHAARAFPGHIQNRNRRGGGHRHHQPDERRQRKARQRRDLEPEGVPRTEVADHSKGEKKDKARNRSQSDQAYVDDAVNALPPAAVFALHEVAFVVTTHLHRQPGNVVSPARQNLAYNRIHALLTHKGLQRQLQLNWRQYFRLHRHQHPVLKQATPLGQRFFRFSPCYLWVIVLLREMRQHYKRCTIIIVPGKEIREFLVRQVPRGTSDPLFHRPWVGPRSQQLNAMI